MQLSRGANRCNWGKVRARSGLIQLATEIDRPSDRSTDAAGLSRARYVHGNV